MTPQRKAAPQRARRPADILIPVIRATSPSPISAIAGAGNTTSVHHHHHQYPASNSAPLFRVKHHNHDDDDGRSHDTGGNRNDIDSLGYDTTHLTPTPQHYRLSFGFGSRNNPCASTPLHSPTMPPPPPSSSRRGSRAMTPPPPLDQSSQFHSASSTPAAPGTPHNPFNFTTQIISSSPVTSKPSTVGQRRGHKYKHSSISAQHQIFLEPPPRAPLALPRDLPIPTAREAWNSMSPNQRARLYWCCGHGAVAVYVFLKAHGALAVTALSHLVFFDVGSAAVCCVVEVLGNFDVWKRSTVRHPFGLERAEVLAGFAMSIFLIFGGFDLLSHGLKAVLEGMGGGHEAHDQLPLGGGGGAPASVAAAITSSSSSSPVAPEQEIMDTMACLAAVLATLISAYGLRNHARISRVMRVGYLASLPSILSNPFHFLTLSTASMLLALPFFFPSIPAYLDTAICAIVALAMFGLGARLAIAQAYMLLMSYSSHHHHHHHHHSSSSEKANPNDGLTNVVKEIADEPNIESIEEAQFWQVHYGLCVANLKVCVRKGCDESALGRLRIRVAALVQNRLGEGYGKGNGLRWEVSLQARTER